MSSSKLSGRRANAPAPHVCHPPPPVVPPPPPILGTAWFDPDWCYPVPGGTDLAVLYAQHDGVPVGSAVDVEWFDEPPTATEVNPPKNYTAGLYEILGDIEEITTITAVCTFSDGSTASAVLNVNCFY